MSLLFRSAPTPQVAQRGLGAAFLARLSGDYASSAVVVNSADSAMRATAVWGCVTKISQDVSMMPVDVGRKGPRGWEDVDPPQILTAPSTVHDDMDWRYQVVASWLTAGNSWGMVTDRIGNTMLRLEIIAPQSVRVHPVPGDMPELYVNEVRQWLWPVGNLWWKPAYTMPGQFLGLSPIAYHAAKIGLGLTAAKFGADYLGDGGHPSALIQPETDIGDTAAKTLKDRFMALTRGNREPIVLPQSVKYTPIQINPQESQFLETMRYTENDIIAKVYLEDPADYGSSGDGNSITYANRSDTDLARYKRRQFWVTKLQKALTEMVPPGVIVRLNTSSALMMTTKERHELHALRLKSQTQTVNEVRVINDEPPFPDKKYDSPTPAPAPNAQGGAE